MKKSILLFLLFIGCSFLWATQYTISYTVSPATFNEDQSITITFTDIDETAWGVDSSHDLYLWAWSKDTSGAQQDSPNNGTWGNSDAASKLTYVSSGTYKITFTPTTYFGRIGLAEISFLVKTKTGNNQSQDITVPVGAFRILDSNPSDGSTTVVSPGSTQTITATTSLPANFVLKANGTTVDTDNSGSTSYSYTYTVNTSSQIELTATQASDTSKTQSVSFTLLPTPNVQTATMPAYMQQGINYKPGDATTVGLALYAPGKSYVHVIGSFNNWQISNTYLMKRSTANPDIFWIEIGGLTPQQVYTFQYRTNDGVKVADPYSPLVLSPDDDPYIKPSVYPNMPVYPAGQQYDVSVIQSGMPQYNWTVTNFDAPKKEDLVIYELLVRDFVTDYENESGWQSLIDQLDYLKSLNINAIELMPVMEFDGNNSWGYNPSFHYALDKAYGTPNKFKEFIDKAHQKGIAIILDIALNHATGRSPLERLWSTSPDGSYGGVAADNPYFNQEAKHTYSVFYDFNHSQPATRYYVKRVLEHWIKEYKIDGFRWDLTKGFTQNCTSTDQACTDAYQQDRVDVLNLYANDQRSFDADSYVIFEHLGNSDEEKNWAGNGIMLWDKLNEQYNQNTMGYASNSNFNRVDFENHGFSERRNVAFAESHDEERLMYKNLQSGNSQGTYDIKTLATALKRQEALGAVFLTIPGPKMIWQFGELGFDLSINRCQDGSVSNNCRTERKPSAFLWGYNHQSNRLAVYNTWAKILKLRQSNEVFDTTTFTVESGDLTPRIYIWKNSLPANTLKNVVILANFTLEAQNIVPDFPYTGDWVNLMNGEVTTVSNTTAPISIEAGGFRIFGNHQPLATEDIATSENKLGFQLVQNPIINHTASIKYTHVNDGKLYFYDLSGKLMKVVTVENNGSTQDIPLQDLGSGLYLIQLKSEQGTATTKMIIP